MFRGASSGLGRRLAATPRFRSVLMRSRLRIRSTDWSVSPSTDLLPRGRKCAMRTETRLTIAPRICAGTLDPGTLTTRSGTAGIGTPRKAGARVGTSTPPRTQGGRIAAGAGVFVAMPTSRIGRTTRPRSLLAGRRRLTACTDTSWKATNTQATAVASPVSKRERRRGASPGTSRPADTSERETPECVSPYAVRKVMLVTVGVWGACSYVPKRHLPRGVAGAWETGTPELAAGVDTRRYRGV